MSFLRSLAGVASVAVLSVLVGCDVDPAQREEPRSADVPADRVPDCPPESALQPAACAAGWCSIPAGCFTMGTDPSAPCRTSSEHAHLVQITRGFLIAATETTQAAFEQLMGYNPAANQACGGQCPVENVSWHEAAAYCNALSAAEGRADCYVCAGGQAADRSDLVCEPADGPDPGAIIGCSGYRLPTEAEWEHAARAGQQTSYASGEPTSCHGEDPQADAVAWYAGNSGGQTHPVASKLVNGWGLYDTSGNVDEWTNDGNEEIGDAPAVDPAGAAFAVSISVRGGSFAGRPEQVRVTSRTEQASEVRSDKIGFRCVRTQP